MRMIEARLRGEQAQGLAGADASHQAGRDEQPDPLELAMYARVMTSSPKPGAAETAIAEWPQHIGAFKGKGLVAGYLFFDRSRQPVSVDHDLGERGGAEAERDEPRADPRPRRVHEAPHGCAGPEHLRSGRSREVIGYLGSCVPRRSSATNPQCPQAPRQPTRDHRPTRNRQRSALDPQLVGGGGDGSQNQLCLLSLGLVPHDATPLKAFG